MTITQQTRYVKLVVAALALFLLAACSAPLPTATPTLPPTASPTLAPTHTLAPTATSAPTRTPKPLPTHTSSPTAALKSDFSQAKLSTAGYLPGYRFFIAIELPDPVKGEYYALVDENKEYTCSIPGNYPNRLYCSGQLTKVDGWVSYVIYTQGTDEEVFEGEVYAPYRLPY